jgi:formylglycine-generating enzyme required for sulfatase activity
MVGNAYEWVADWFKSYPDAKRFIDNTAERRFPRGGCWDDGPKNNRCAYRGWSLPPDRSGPNPQSDCDHIGFRVARTVKDPLEARARNMLKRVAIKVVDGADPIE